MLPPELTDANLSWGVISGFFPRDEYPVTDRARLDEMFDEDVQHSYQVREWIKREGLEYTCADGLWIYKGTHKIFDRSFVIFSDDDERLVRLIRNLKVGGVVKHRGVSDAATVYLSCGDTVTCPLFPQNTTENPYSLTRKSGNLDQYKQFEIGVSLNAGFANAMRLHTFCKRLNGSPVDH